MKSNDSNAANNLNFQNSGPANKSTFDPVNHLGYLGKFFGGVENAPATIGGLIVILLIIIATFITFFNTKIDPMEFWKTITLPLITGFFGYLFGKQRQK